MISFKRVHPLKTIFQRRPACRKIMKYLASSYVLWDELMIPVLDWLLWAQAVYVGALPPCLMQSKNDFKSSLVALTVFPVLKQWANRQSNNLKNRKDVMNMINLRESMPYSKRPAGVNAWNDTIDLKWNRLANSWPDDEIEWKRTFLFKLCTACY